MINVHHSSFLAKEQILNIKVIVKCQLQYEVKYKEKEKMENTKLCAMKNHPKLPSGLSPTVPRKQDERLM